MKNIVIFSPEKPYTGAESLVTAKLTKALLNYGWNVKLVFHDKELVSPERFDILDISHCTISIKNTLILKLRDKIHSRNKFSFLIYIIDKIDIIVWVIKAFCLFVKLNRNYKFNLIMSRIMPQYGHLPVLFLSVFYRKLNWIANWSDPYPHTKSPKPYGEGLEAQSNYFSLLYAKLVVRYSRFSIFPSDRLANYFKVYLPELENKSLVLPHIILNKPYSHINNNSNSIVITHIGSFGLRSPENLIRAFKKYIEEESSECLIKFRFIGYVDEYISNIIAELKIENYFSLEGKKNYEEVLDEINNSDIMLVVEADLLEGVFLPSKVMDYLQYDKPIFSISPQEGVMNDLITKHGGGICVNCNSINEICDSLKKIEKEITLIKSNVGIYSTSNLKSLFLEDVIINRITRL